MEHSSLVQIVKRKHPYLADRITITSNDNAETGELIFHNPRYYLWFSQEKEGGFIVGINFLHSHFDLHDDQTNLEDALEYIDDIITDKIVAIGLIKEENDFHLATMEKEEGIKAYFQEKPNVEIVSFTKEY